ncbi:unnamed protein product [Linum tenue]|uniref:Uncharacterized protein n=1 Tax=Linum tenue TaxID=586396 RepID=A0AAV0IXV9_9ROSI|nr:unnamed protein product [Linum tenue]
MRTPSTISTSTIQRRTAVDRVTGVNRNLDMDRNTVAGLNRSTKAVVGLNMEGESRDMGRKMKVMRGVTRRPSMALEVTGGRIAPRSLLTGGAAMTMTMTKAMAARNMEIMTLARMTTRGGSIAISITTIAATMTMNDRLISHLLRLYRESHACDTSPSSTQ